MTYQRLADIFKQNSGVSNAAELATLDRQILAGLGSPRYAKRHPEQGITYEWHSPDCPGWYILASFNIGSYVITTAEIPPPIGTVLAENATTGLRYTLVGHPREVTALTIVPNGQTLISGSPDGQVHFWQLSDGKHLQMINVKDWVNSLKVSSDGKQLLSLGSTLTTWDIATGKQSQEWEFTKGGMIHNVFSPDQRLIISEINDEVVNLWNVTTRKRVSSFSQPQYRVGAIALHPNHRILADARNQGWGANQNAILLWDLPSSKPVQTLSGHNYLVRAIEFSPKGSILASGSEPASLRTAKPSEIKLWNWQKGILVRTLIGDASGIRSLVFSGDGQRLASGSQNGQIDIWHVPTGKRLQVLTGHTNAVTTLIFDVTGQRLISGSDDRTVKVWQLSQTK